MDDETRSIIALRVARAHEDVEIARELIDLRRYRVSATRSYFAILNATTAILLTKGLVRAKHAGVQGAFGEQFVRPGLIEPDYARIFALARKAREESDYADQVIFSLEYAQKHLADAERFVARMEKYLKDAGAID